MFRGSVYKLCGLLILLLGSAVMVTLCLVSGKFPWLLVAVPLLVWGVAGLFRFHSQGIRKMTFMFNSIENGDYAFKFTEYDGPISDNLLNISLNRIKNILVKARTQVIEQEKYYELILNSVNTGVIVINDAGNVYQINQAALQLFGLPVLNHVNRLSVIDGSLAELFLNLMAGEKKQASFSNERGVVHLAISVSSIQVRDMPLRIVAISDINNELDEKETESWIRLIRVLTHEIMNSVTPITSLSDTLLKMDDSMNDDVREGIEAINSTGRGLISFVESYRQLTRIPAPRFKSFYVRPFLERMCTLVCHTDRDRVLNVEVEVVPDDLLLYADEDMVGQVILNLLKNAIHALDGLPDGRIRICAESSDAGEISLSVTDNGCGIPPEVAANIFMPFFTTKENGSGIGLSVSRQIMRLHNGSISLRCSRPGETTFRLLFD